ncbi:hypothetical protein AVEN_138815-1 [Araneus ventricosus]|uniref:Uncharacterized protein n=2 Tax=Araneus ventricosus TaxID=182803 RepID=A0A4Y2LZL9_ARAVE|nr:hypothetical protein AVEN_138815-1 [Araneus ventricosus]
MKVSLISAKKVPLSTSPEGNTMLAMFNRVFKCLESIQEDIKVMKAEQIKIQSQLSEMCNQEGPVNNFTLPTGISIPVETDSDLIQFNSNLRGEKSLTAALARYLYGVSFGCFHFVCF